MVRTEGRDARGPVALVGGNEFHAPAKDLDLRLLELSGSSIVVFLPTANAGRDPKADVATARRYFKGFDVVVEPCNVLSRKDAESPDYIDLLDSARFVYIGGGSPRRLASILRGSGTWEAILRANAAGGVLAGSSAGAMFLFEIMRAPRWARPSEGLGIFRNAVVLPHHDAWIRRAHLVTRAGDLPPGIDVIAIDECTGLILLPDGSCEVRGAGKARVYRDGAVRWERLSPSGAGACPGDWSR